MKIFKIITIATGTNAMSIPADNCHDGLYPVEGRCDAFYICHHGIRTPMQVCPDGLLYDAYGKYCNWAKDVTCHYLN